MARPNAFGYVSIGNTQVSFAENIQIKESGRSRTSEFNIVGRQHTLFAQLGAFSRQYTITFNLTQRSDTLDMLNAIRRSTYSQDTINLPVVSVRYGEAFAGAGAGAVKGICKSYNITIDEQAGYNGTIPNRVRVTMVLSEITTPRPSGGIIVPTTPG